MDDTIRMAEERLGELGSDEETRMLYAAREKALRDRISFIEDARLEGIEQGIEQVARNMLSKGVDRAIIVEYTGLTADQIEKLR